MTAVASTLSVRHHCSSLQCALHRRWFVLVGVPSCHFLSQWLVQALSLSDPWRYIWTTFLWCQVDLVKIFNALSFRLRCFLAFGAVQSLSSRCLLRATVLIVSLPSCVSLHCPVLDAVFGDGLRHHLGVSCLPSLSCLRRCIRAMVFVVILESSVSPGCPVLGTFGVRCSSTLPACRLPVPHRILSSLDYPAFSKFNCCLCHAHCANVTLHRNLVPNSFFEWSNSSIFFSARSWKIYAVISGNPHEIYLEKLEA